MSPTRKLVRAKERKRKYENGKRATRRRNSLRYSDKIPIEFQLDQELNIQRFITPDAEQKNLAFTSSQQC